MVRLRYLVTKLRIERNVVFFEAFFKKEPHLGIGEDAVDFGQNDGYHLFWQNKKTITKKSRKCAPTETQIKTFQGHGPQTETKRVLKDIVERWRWQPIRGVSSSSN